MWPRATSPAARKTQQEKVQEFYPTRRRPWLAAVREGQDFSRAAKGQDKDHIGFPLISPRYDS
jgi:hypothetical protein